MTIQNLGMQYNALQMTMGAAGEQTWSRNINELFSEGFTKTINGKILVGARSQLQNQITQCRKDAGDWKIEEKAIIPSADNKQCNIRYIISTENAGNFDVIAILSSSNGEQIDSIDEVCYQM